MRALKCLMITIFLLMVSACVDTQDPQNAAQQSSHLNARKSNPKAAEVNVQLGVSYLKQGDIERAKAKLLMAEQQAPNSPLVLGALGYYAEMTGDKRKAERYYSKAIAIRPGNGDALNNYGAFLCRTGHYEEAERYFVAAIRDPDYLKAAEAYENAGLCAMEIPNEKLAELYFTKALKKNARLPNSLLEMSEIFFNQQDYDRAGFYLKESLEYAKPSPKSLWLDLRLARQRGDRDKVDSDALLLKQHYPNSREFKAYTMVEK